MTSYRTPLSRARGLGSAKHGLSHWLGEQVSSLVLILLTPWAICSGVALSRTDSLGAAQWLASPLNAVLTLILLTVGFYYLHATMRVVIEDYIQTPATRIFALLLNSTLCWGLWSVAAFSILRVAFVGGPVH